MARRVRQKQQRRKERERAAGVEARERTAKLIAIIGVVVLLATGLGYLVVNTFGGSTPSGSLASDFTLVDSNGNAFRLGQFRGRPVILFFMTTSDWCLPCKIETRDHLRPLYYTYGSRVQIISIELLANERSDADLNAYKATYASPWIYARDTARVGSTYGVTALSTIVIVDQVGYIRFRAADPTYDQMSNLLRSLSL